MSHSKAVPLMKPRLSAQQTFSALRHPNYRLWFAGQLVSLVGTWMQTTAQGFLVFELTHSPAYLGYVGFAAGLPSWLFMLYGGVAADRISRRKLLIITQTAMMIMAGILAGLTFAGWVRPWHIILLAFGFGVANAFDAPTRLAFVLEMVSRDDLTNAIALNSTMFNAATAIGPAAAGITYALLGPAWCFAVNTISFIAVIIALVLMKLKPLPARSRQNSILADVKSALKYAASQTIVRTVILNLAAVSLFGMGFVTLMPAWAVNVLGGDATTNGLLQSARGIGALAGALMVAALSHLNIRGKLLTIGSFAFPSLLLVFSTIRWLPLSLLALVGLGWGMMVMMNSSNALVQIQVPDNLRGRVMSIYSLTFFGLMPVGSLLAGAFASRFGEPLTVALASGALLFAATLAFVGVPALRKDQEVTDHPPDGPALDQGRDMD